MQGQPEGKFKKGRHSQQRTSQRFSKKQECKKQYNVKLIEEIKPIWAAYFNMARSNMFKTLRHISLLTGFNDQSSEESIWNMSVLNAKNLKNEQKGKLLKLLPEHFPFLNHLNPDNLDEMRETLKLFSHSLSYHRNQYSHNNSFTKANGTDSKIGDCLIKLSIISTRIIKERFSSETNKQQAGILTSTSLNFITNGRTLRNSESPYNNKHFLYPKTTEGMLSDVGMRQLLSLFLEKKYINELLSQSGFLHCFNGSAEGIEMTEKRLLLEIFGALRFRVPRLKLSIAQDEVRVALDILNEMHKCPKDLYELLDEKDKAIFNIATPLTLSPLENDTTDEASELALMCRYSDRFPQLVLSYFDCAKLFKNLRFQLNAGKFRYLFNEDKTFCDGTNGIRVLEKDLNAFCRKQELENKRLEAKNKRAYRKLWKNYEIKGHEDAPRNDKTCLLYITDSQTSYLFNGNNIGIRIGEFEARKDDPSQYYIKSTGDFVPEINYDNTSGKYEVQCKKPDCVISRFELAGMLFHHLLLTNSKQKVNSNSGSSASTLKSSDMNATEKMIIDTVWNYRRFFNDITNDNLNPDNCTEAKLSEYHINKTDIPQKLVEYLFPRLDTESKKSSADNKLFLEHKENYIKELTSNTEYLLAKHKQDVERIQTKDNKPGKRNYVRIQSGKLADWLAKDIVIFQEEDEETIVKKKGISKITGANYAVMQASIATFYNPDGTADNELRKIFMNLGLVGINGKRGSHPFLYNVSLNVENTSYFYMSYLKERKKFLEGPIDDNAYFLHSNRRKWKTRDAQYYKDLAAEYLNRPIMLPQGLFEKEIKNILIGENNTKLSNAIKVAVENGRCNTSFMIDRYYKYVLNQESQFFYEFEKRKCNHKFFNMVSKNPDWAQKALDEKIKDCGEHKIRTDIFNKAFDWARKLPAKRAVVQNAGSEKHYKEQLNRAYCDFTSTEKNIRRYAVQDKLLFLAAVNILEKNGVASNEIKLKDARPDRDWLLDKEIAVDTSINLNYSKESFSVNLHQDKVKILNYGKIKRLLHDTRLYALLFNFKDETVDLNELEQELTEYDSSRINMFRLFLEYEKKMLPDNLDKEDSIFLEAINNDTINSDNDKEMLRVVRNAFCHNEYPARVNEKLTMPLYDNKLPDIAKSLYEKVEAIVDKVCRTK